jgi:hypothetical protein
LFFLLKPEDDNKFIWNVGILLPHYTSHPRRQYSPQSMQWEPQLQRYNMWHNWKRQPLLGYGTVNRQYRH